LPKLAQVGQTLDDDDTRLQQDLMHHGDFIPRIRSKRGDRSRLDAYKGDLAFDEPAGQLRRYPGLIRAVVLHLGVQRPVGAQNHAGPGMDAVGIGKHILNSDRGIGSFMSQIEDRGWTDAALQEDIVDSIAAIHEVERGIHVGAGVAVQMQGSSVAADVGDRALLLGLQAANALIQRLGQINYASGHSIFSSSAL